MKRLILIAALLAASFQTAKAAPEAGQTGEKLFAENCAICHAKGQQYPGYLNLQQLGQPQPELSLRTDLQADYVKTVVRQGLGAMPPFTPGLIDEPALDKIAAYLTRKH